MSAYCWTCGRSLSNPESVARGHGPVCSGAGYTQRPSLASMKIEWALAPKMSWEHADAPIGDCGETSAVFDEIQRAEGAAMAEAFARLWRACFSIQGVLDLLEEVEMEGGGA